MVLGIPDFWIWSVFLLCLGSALLCVIYGLINWNKGAESENFDIAEESAWEEKEKDIVDNL